MSFKTAVVVSLVYLIHETFATISKFHEIKNGTCESETFKSEVLLACDVTDVTINIVTKHDDNLLAQCSKSREKLGCHVDPTANAVHNKSSNTMTFSTKFNHTKHAGNKLWINSTCFNGSTNQESVLLKPCVTGFTVSGLHNTTHVTIVCEHLSFNASVAGIHIHGKETLATCSSQKHRCTHGATALPNGVQYTTPYIPGMEISCSLDGQKILITIQKQSSSLDGQKIPITIQNQPESLHNKGEDQTTESYNSGDVRKAWPVFVTIGFSVLVYYILRDVFI